MKAVTPGNQLLKFADDTYVIVPTANVHSRQTELKNIEELSRANNLKPNPTKYAETVFVNKRRKVKVQRPLPLLETARFTVLKILGVTVTNICLLRNMFPQSLVLAHNYALCFFVRTAWTTVRYSQFTVLSSLRS